MNDRRDKDADTRLDVLHELEEEDAWIDGDVLEVGEATWAIHGIIPYGGEVEIAAFATYDEARRALDGVRDPARPPTEA